ncbi:MAG: NusG domain II-containing protein [Coriobacteriales bacterium]|jgi:hypothetical protein|nr:NusG domain II-containing protein [Coriobacteriales bacterium]
MKATDGATTAGDGATRRSVLLGVGVFVAALLAQAGVMLFGALRKGQTALITDGDGAVHELPLNSAKRVEITTALGSNTVEVADGQIRIVDSTCKNKDCIHQGAISNPGQTIVCLPNRFVIRIKESDSPEDNGNGSDGNDVDAVSG